MKAGRGKYRTRQRGLILSYLSENSDGHVTAEMIAESLKGQVGLTTVYRNLDALIKEGVVVRHEGAGASAGACYRYITPHGAHCGFYHFMCTGCGQILHLDCERLGYLTSHIQEDHGLSLDMGKTVLYGSCAKCVSAAGDKKEGVE